MKNIEGEIIVIDNNSSDGSREFFLNKFNEVKFIWNHENEGFAKANNKSHNKKTRDVASEKKKKKKKKKKH